MLFDIDLSIIVIVLSLDVGLVVVLVVACTVPAVPAKGFWLSMGSEDFLVIERIRKAKQKTEK